MRRVHVRYLVAHKQKSHVLYYWQPTPKLRAAGFHCKRLPDDLPAAIVAAEAENRKLDAWRKGVPLDPPLRHRADGLQALHELFQRDDGFRRMAPRTQRDYLNSIKHVLPWAVGRAADIDRQVVRTWYRELRDQRGPASARNIVAALRRLLSFGVDEGWFKLNPALNLRMATPGGVHRVWTDAERARFCAAAEAEGWHSMALAVTLGWCLGQRPADLRTLTWSAYDGRSITLRQAKTGQEVWVPALPELRALLDDTPRTAAQIVVSERTKRPYGESDFQHRFADLRARAGLPPDLQFRHLRHTMAQALGRAGCTDDQIRAITGHKTRGVVARYLKPDRVMGEGAMGKLRATRAKGGAG